MTDAGCLSKWSQQPQLPAPADAPVLSQQEVASLFDFGALGQVVPKLLFGTASDSMGWHAESFTSLVREPRLRRAFHSILQAYLTGDTGTTSWDLINSSAIIPLSKKAHKPAL